MEIVRKGKSEEDKIVSGETPPKAALGFDKSIT
jgi:hypothetical protein